MSMIQLKPNTPITLRGKPGYIRYAAQDIFLIDFPDSDPLMVKPGQLADWFSSGLMKIQRKEKSVVLTTFANEMEAAKYDFYKYCLDKMDLHKTPNCRPFVRSLLDEAQKIYGWPDGRPFCDSTMIARYNKWKDADRCYSIFLRKAKVNFRRKKTGFKYELAQEVFDNYYLSSACPTRADAFRLYYQKFARALEMANAESREDGSESLGDPLKKTAFYDFVNSFDPVEVMKARKGLKAARKAFRGRSGNHQALYPGERIEVDAVHPQIGLVVVDKNTGEEKVYKPIIYVAFDVFTRLVVGYHISVSEKASETANAVIQLIKHMVKPDKRSSSAQNHWITIGAPEVFVSDLGTAFTAKWVRSMLASLHCTHHMCEAASPWKKPFVESFNNTIKVQFANKMPGYVGNRKRGEVIDSSLEEMAVLTKDEFISEFERYVLDYYHQNPHRGLGNISPIQAWKQYEHTALPINPHVYEKIKGLSGVDHVAKLRETGVHINGLEYTSTELLELRKTLTMISTTRKQCPKVTILVNNDDVSKIGVLDEINNEIIPVPCKDLTIVEGTSLQEKKANQVSRNLLATKGFTSDVGKNRKKNNKKTKSKPAANNYHELDDPLDDDTLREMLGNGNGLSTRDFSHLHVRDTPDNEAGQEPFNYDDLEQF